MQKLVKIFVSASMVLACGGVLSEGAGELDRVHFGHYGDIRTMYRAGDSLWVGTGGGLFIYDLGRREVSALLIGGDGLPCSSIRAIAARGDSVFVGTDRGLSVFDRNSVAVFTSEHPGPYENAPFESIRSIDFGLDRVIYLSTFGYGVGVLDGDTSWVITREDSLLDDKVYGMIQEDDTTFYFATSMGLCAYRDSAWVGFQAGAGIPRGETRKLLTAPEGGYYLLVGGLGVYKFDGRRARRISRPGVIPEDAISDMAVDSRGNLWACGGFGGIAVYQNGHWTPINETDPKINIERWRCALADGEGGVFFGSADGSIITIRDNVLTRIRLPDELRTGSVSSITADSTRALYLLDGSYLFRIDSQGQTLRLDYPRPVVVALAVSPRGQLLVATRWGVYRRETGGYVELDLEVTEKAPLYSALGFGAKGCLWVGTQAGNVYRYDGEIWMRMGDGDDLGVGSARSFDVDGRSRVWVTGSGGGVSLFDGAGWTSFENSHTGGRPARDLTISPNGIPVLATDEAIWGYVDAGKWRPVEFVNENNDSDLGRNQPRLWEPGSPAILALEFDAEGRLFVGTENGLAIVDKTRTRWVTQADGLGGIAVTSLYVEHDQNLWVGFRRDGLTRIVLESLW